MVNLFLDALDRPAIRFGAMASVVPVIHYRLSVANGISRQRTKLGTQEAKAWKAATVQVLAAWTVSVSEQRAMVSSGYAGCRQAAIDYLIDSRAVFPEHPS